MGSTAKKIVITALAAPAVLFGAGLAHANALQVQANPQITKDGIWIGWHGGNGATWCNVSTDWTSARAYQDDQGKGGVFLASYPLNRASNYHIDCENGDTGFIGGIYY